MLKLSCCHVLGVADSFLDLDSAVQLRLPQPSAVVQLCGRSTNTVPTLLCGVRPSCDGPIMLCSSSP